MYALAFATVLPSLKEIANEHGYALAVHGSMRRDLDLIACPWVEEASEPHVLVEAIRIAIGGVYTWQHGDTCEPVKKPHGRLGWAIYVDPNTPGRAHGGPFIDISVMPKSPFVA